MNQPAKRQKIVLVVEDEPLLLMMAVDMIEDAGYEAIEAIDAAQAIEILERRNDICIVFTDIEMPPGMSGLKMAALIRDRWPPIELIITSGKVKLQAQDMPPRGVFFSKPYREQDLVAALHRMAA